MEAFITKAGKPYGHGLFITFPQTNCDLDTAKIIWIKIDMAIRNLNKNLHDCQGGCCVENHNQTSGSHLHMLFNYPKQERFYLTL